MKCNRCGEELVFSIAGDLVCDSCQICYFPSTRYYKKEFN